MTKVKLRLPYLTKHSGYGSFDPSS
jgi:hypothetical protein